MAKVGTVDPQVGREDSLSCRPPPAGTTSEGCHAERAQRPRWSLERWSGDLCAQTGSWSGHNCPICQDTGGLPVRSAWCWAAWCSRPGVGAHRGLSEGGGQQDAERKTGLKVDTNFRVTRNLSSPSALLFGLRGGVIVQPLEEGEIFFVPVTS